MPTAEQRFVSFPNKYGPYVNTVKNQYRNPSVHKELVSQQSALSCLDYVVDVEKKLKEMVSAFQN